MQNKTKKCFYTYILIATCALILYCIFIQNKSFKRARLVKSTNHLSADKKVVLFANHFFDEPFLGMPNKTNGEEYLKSIQCQVTNCIFTHDKKYLPHPHLYDAIAFHTVEPWVRADRPQTRSSEQLYIFVLLE